MKKEKGFTLIELLAVIVILAVVALVATPIVLNVINSSREKARLSSAYGVVDAARLDYIQKKYEDAIIPTTNVLDSLTIGGEKPTGDVRINENGEIAIALIYDGTRCYKKGYDDSDITKTTIEVGGECIIDGIPSEEPIVPWPTYSESIQNLIDGAVTSGDGLYLETTDGTYRYKGGNPSNYIRLFAGNDGIFRIISINNQGMKVVSAQGAVYNEWDAKDNHDVSGSENTYCTDEINNGCNAWSSVLGIYSNRDLTGTVSTNSSILTYLEDVYYVNNLNEISSKIIENAT